MVNARRQVAGAVHKSELEMFAGSERNLKSDRKLRIYGLVSPFLRSSLSLTSGESRRVSKDDYRFVRSFRWRGS